MNTNDSTCWTMIQAAAAGNGSDRDEFVRRYCTIVRDFLVKHWSGSNYLQELDDAVQEVFFECFKEGGVVQRADQTRPSGFRSFLFGVVRNVALRMETKAVRRLKKEEAGAVDLDQIISDEATASHLFDRCWARAILREAAARQELRAQAAGPREQRQVDLFRMHFHDGLPIRKIAESWKEDPAVLHHEYAIARQGFKEALLEVLRFDLPGSPDQIEAECRKLLALIG
jgi:RNA polymerase sigma factor (sigma-70 family)